MITQLVMEKMEKTTEGQAPEVTTTPTEPLIKFYDTAATSGAREIAEPMSTTSEPLIQLYQQGIPQQAHIAPATFEQPLNVAVPIKPFQFEADTLTDSIQAAKKHTPARIGVGRAGTRPKTKTWLKFRLDHAAAVDAVYGEVTEDLLQKLDVFQVTTKVTDKEVIISNGLSASAIEENVQDVYLALQQSLSNLNIDIGTTFYIDKGRVALMDEIGELLQAEVIVYLIGERPGLVSAESMSAYLCYKPRIGTVEAERMVISNIHKGGIPPLEAGAYLGTIVQKILHYEASGVELVAKEG